MPLSVEEENEHIKWFVTAVHSIYLYDKEQEKACAQALGLSLTAIYHAKTQAKGTIFTHGRIFCWGMRIPADKLKNFFPRIKKTVVAKDKINYFDKLLIKALKLYSIDELTATLQLLLDKYKIEERVRLRKKPGRPRKNHK